MAGRGNTVVSGTAAGLEFGLALRSDGGLVRLGRDPDRRHLGSHLGVDLGQPKRQGPGDGTLTSRSIPVRVTGVPAYIADISAGRDFAAATGTNGEVWS